MGLVSPKDLQAVRIQKQLFSLIQQEKEAREKIQELIQQIQSKRDELIGLGASERSRSEVEMFLRGELRAPRQKSESNSSSRGRLPNFAKIITQKSLAEIAEQLKGRDKTKIQSKMIYDGIDKKTINELMELL